MQSSRGGHSRSRGKRESMVLPSEGTGQEGDPVEMRGGIAAPITKDRGTVCEDFKSKAK